jgi:hypothetical protein
VLDRAAAVQKDKEDMKDMQDKVSELSKSYYYYEEVAHIKINVFVNIIFIELLLLLFINTNTKMFQINL